MNPFQMPMVPQQQQQRGIPNQINPQQFKQFLPNLNDNILNQLVAQARQQGMNEQDIQAGLNFIQQLR